MGPLFLTLALLAPAHAGYGDAVDGIPNYAEREVHLWTNAVRVQPDYFALDYDCPFGSFQASEQTPKIPLWWHDGLGEISRLHSEDMASTGILQHNSSDGTSMSTRVGPYYPADYVGENVAQGYPTAWDVVIEGWMCSSGHRANIMLPDYEDLGVGVAQQEWWTQDFGARGANREQLSARLGMHFPAYPSGEAEYRVAVYTGDDPPDAVYAVVNGSPYPLRVQIGTETSGIWQGTAPIEDDCTAYWFEVHRAGGGIDQYPQDGAYGFGDCPWTDSEARWILRADVPALQAVPFEVVEDGCGCAHGGGGVPALALLLPIGLLRRRR